MLSVCTLRRSAKALSRLPSHLLKHAIPDVGLGNVHVHSYCGCIDV